jgi:hypothetical protein
MRGLPGSGQRSAASRKIAEALVSDGVYLLLAATVAVAFVVVVLASNPEGRNPHVDARRQRRWWTRDHD